MLKPSTCILHAVLESIAEPRIDREGRMRLDLAVLAQGPRAEIAAAQRAEPSRLLAELEAEGGDPDGREHEIVAGTISRQAERPEGVARDPAGEVSEPIREPRGVEAPEARMRAGDVGVRVGPARDLVIARPFEAVAAAGAPVDAHRIVGAERLLGVEILPEQAQARVQSWEDPLAAEAELGAARLRQELHVRDVRIRPSIRRPVIERAADVLGAQAFAEVQEELGVVEGSEHGPEFRAREEPPELAIVEAAQSVGSCERFRGMAVIGVLGNEGRIGAESQRRVGDGVHGAVHIVEAEAFRRAEPGRPELGRVRPKPVDIFLDIVVRDLVELHPLKRVAVAVQDEVGEALIADARLHLASPGGYISSHAWP